MTLRLLLPANFIGPQLPGICQLDLGMKVSLTRHSPLGGR